MATARRRRRDADADRRELFFSKKKKTSDTRRRRDRAASASRRHRRRVGAALGQRGKRGGGTALAGDVGLAASDPRRLAGRPSMASSRCARTLTQTPFGRRWKARRRCQRLAAARRARARRHARRRRGGLRDGAPRRATLAWTVVAGGRSPSSAARWRGRGARAAVASGGSPHSRRRAAGRATAAAPSARRRRRTASPRAAASSPRPTRATAAALAADLAAGDGEMVRRRARRGARANALAHLESSSREWCIKGSFRPDRRPAAACTRTRARRLGSSPAIRLDRRRHRPLGTVRSARGSSVGRCARRSRRLRRRTAAAAAARPRCVRWPAHAATGRGARAKRRGPPGAAVGALARIRCGTLSRA